MRTLILSILFALATAFPASAQRLNLEFPGLAEKADEVVDVTLDADMLRIASKFFSAKKADERAVREMISGLQGIYVRSYEFAKEGEYDPAIAERLKSQLGSSWKALVTVRSKKKENVNIYADMRGEEILGLVIIAAEPKEFTVVNIVGRIDLDRLADLEGEFGIPRITTGNDNE